MLHRLDVLSSMLTRTRPRFVPTDSQSSDLPFTSNFGILQCDPLSNSLTNFTTLLVELQSLTAFQTEISRPSGATVIEVHQFDVRRSAIEYQLLNLQFSAQNISPHEQVFHACCIAAMIYTSFIFRGFRPEFAVLLTLKKNLMGTLGNLILKDVGTTMLDVCLWMLFTGGMLSIAAEEKTWFATRILPLIIQAGYHHWEEVEICLSRVLWTKKMDNEGCKSIWRDVEAMLDLPAFKRE